MTEDRLDHLLAEGARSLRRPPDPEISGRVLAPLRARRRASLLRLGGWGAAAAVLLLAVVFTPSPFGSGPAPVVPPRSAPPPAEPAVVAQELAGLGEDARSAADFLGRRVPLVSRILSR